MADVMAFEVPTFPGGGSKYPSVNGMWASGVRYGKKTPEYHDLFVAVRRAAAAEIARVAWVTAEDRVEVHLRRYVPDNRLRDASNCGKCELDALARWKQGEPEHGFPGVYVDDRYVRPFLDVVVDPREGAVDRIAIAIFRVVLFGMDRPAPRRRRHPMAVAIAEGEAALELHARGVPVNVDKRYATLNGKRIPLEDALEMVNREDGGGRRRGR